jgi:transposase InsO family protein
MGHWAGRDAVPPGHRQRLGLHSRSYTALVRSYGLRQEFITPHTPEQNGMVERVIRTFKEQCAHRHRFETLQHASRVIGRLDQLLQPPAAASSPRYEDTGGNVRLSSLT